MTQRRRTIRVGTSAALIWLTLVILVAIGWVLNLLALIGATAITGEVIVRTIGIVFVPVGAIMGWFF